RSVFIVDPKNKVRLTLTYPKSVGRNFGEILRVIDALQLTDAAPVSTPVDWQPGERVIVAPTLSTDDARQRFENVEEVRRYLRWAKQPQPGAPRGASQAVRAGFRRSGAPPATCSREGPVMIQRGSVTRLAGPVRDGLQRGGCAASFSQAGRGGAAAGGAAAAAGGGDVAAAGACPIAARGTRRRGQLRPVPARGR